MFKLSFTEKLSVQSTETLDQRYVRQLIEIFKKHFPADLPETIWHYTSFEKFTAILKSNELWFTHVSELNDTTEVELAANISRHLLDKQTNLSNLGEREKFLLQRARNGLLEKNVDSTWYTSSFSTEHDDLTQWNAYGIHGQGIAIGFNSRELIKFFSNSIEDRPMVCQVCYEIAILESFGNSLIAATLKNFIDDFSHIKNAKIASDQFIQLWGRHIDAFSIVPKNPRFSSEKEWRLASQVKNDFDRQKLHSVLGRQHMKMGKGLKSDSMHNRIPITQLVLGPTFGLLNELELTLKKFKATDIEILKSKIPLRMTS